jgi:hypothetical protein
MKLVRLALVSAAVISLVLTPSSRVTGAEAQAAGLTWTIMVYMADDVNNTTPLPWEDNINEMEAATQALGTSVIALVDPPGDNNSELLRVQHDPNGLNNVMISTPIDDHGEVIPASGEVNMASPDTLQRFIEYTLSHYPAENTILDLWGHGSGWPGLCWDNYDLLTLSELRTALVNATSTTGRPLDMIMVDACAEASLEMLYQIRDQARFLLAAENNVPFQGFPYTRILNDLAADPSQTVARFGSEIVSDYIESAWATSPYSTTMGLFNLSRVGDVVDRLSVLSAFGVAYDSIFHGTLNQALDDAETYDTPYEVDFGDLMRQIQGLSLPLEVRKAAIDTMASYRGMITAFEKFDNPDPADGISVRRATGATIYAPSTTFADALYLELDLAATPWYEFGQDSRIVKSTEDRALGPALTYSDSTTDNDTLADSVNLTWSASYDSYSVWIFRHEPGGYVFCGSIRSTSATITVSGVFGELLLAASAASGGRARTYDELNVTLYGNLLVNVRIVSHGDLPSGSYEVRLVVNGLSWQSDAPLGSATFNVSVPTQAEIGDMIAVEVTKKGSGELLASTHAVVLDHDFTTSVEVFEHGAASPGFYILMFLSTLPGILILAFAAMLYADQRKQSTR